MCIVYLSTGSCVSFARQCPAVFSISTEWGGVSGSLFSLRSGLSIPGPDFLSWQFMKVIRFLSSISDTKYKILNTKTLVGFNGWKSMVIRYTYQRIKLPWSFRNMAKYALNACASTKPWFVHCIINSASKQSNFAILLVPVSYLVLCYFLLQIFICVISKVFFVFQLYYSGMTQMIECGRCDTHKVLIFLAISRASEKSLLLGSHLWMVHNDSVECSSEGGNSYKTYLKLHACNAEQFACDNAFCISMEKRCNAIEDCQDGSDEQKCGKLNNTSRIQAWARPSPNYWPGCLGQLYPQHSWHQNLRVQWNNDDKDILHT